MRRLSLEPLETRQVMAGNVSAVLLDGELRISGDAAANWIEIRQVAGADGTGRTFVVKGQPYNGAYDSTDLPTPGTTPTLVNGQAQAQFVATKDILRVLMRGGNDVVQVRSAGETTTQGLYIHTAAGRDYVELERVSMLGTSAPLSIFTGSNADTDRDSVRLNDVKVTSQGLNVGTGGGNDQVVASLVSVQGRTSFNLGDGNDVFNGDELDLGITTFNTAATDTTLPDADRIDLSNSRITVLNASLGVGGDRLWLRENVQVTSRAALRGDDGRDTLIIGPDVGFNKSNIESFESIIIV